MSAPVKKDWNALATGRETLGDPRSCANCMHVKKEGTGAMFWKCTRLGGGYCDWFVIHGPCGLDLKYWTPKPVKPPGFFKRLFTRGA